MTTKKTKYALVRSSAAGVHYGEFVRRDGDAVTLRKARRVWSWSGANTVSEIAMHGCTGGKISCETDEVIVFGCCEVHSMRVAAVLAMAKIAW